MGKIRTALVLTGIQGTSIMGTEKAGKREIR